MILNMENQNIDSIKYNIDNTEFNNQKFIAHIRNNNINEIQTISAHCIKTAEYCSETTKKFGMENFGYYIGIIHDAGKFSDEFQEYILKTARGEEVHRGSVNHTFAAVAYTLKKFHTGEVNKNLTAELAAWTIGSHHGIFDINSLEKKNGFDHRLDYINDNNVIYELSMQRFFENCISEEKLCDIFSRACDEIEKFHNKIFLFCKGLLSTKKESGKTSYSFFLGMAARILLSALIDADRKDTYEFMNNKNNNQKGIPDKKFWERQLNYIKKRIDEFTCDTKINYIRRDISDKAAEFAKNTINGGIFRLNVPTGAGKTLTSFRMATSICASGHANRIIYVLPLLSIIDQNAKIIKEYSCDRNAVTEHHSNVIKENMTQDELDEYELICENWSNDIIVTTLVQFLNTLFSGKTQSIRRMKAFTNAVIIIDEVQTVPLKMLYMFNNALNFLAYCCGCKIILCSATQPCFEKIDYMLKYSENCDIVKIDKQIKETFNRTKIIDKTDTPMSIENLCDFSMELIKDSENLLIICNTKKTVESIFKEIERMSDYGYKIFCLTANMCMKHRQLIFRMINYFLKKHKKIICISTQLVEAGVDFSFETVIRIRAGIDNIAQAAGRCNRSFDYSHICNVYIVRLYDKDENLSYLKDIKNSQNSTEKILYEYNKNPENFDNDILGEKSVEKYYRILFNSQDVKSNFSYPVEKPQKTTIFELLALNSVFAGNDKKYILRQAFKAAGELFEVFDSENFDVIVPYDRKAKKLIADLNSEKAKFDITFVKKIVQKAKPYIVSLFKYQLDKFTQDGMIKSYDNGHIYSLNENCYNRKTGLEIIYNDIY